MASWNEFVQSATKVAKEHNFPLGVLLGQAALETGRGTSSQSQSKNNWFGLGAFDANPNNAFGFKSAEESVKYYINLIKNDPRYKKAWAARGDPVKMIQEIKNAGYATDPNYVQKVTNTREFAQNSKPSQAGAKTAQPTAIPLRPSQQDALNNSNFLNPLGDIKQYKTQKKTGFNLIPQAYAEEPNYSPQSSANMYTVKPGDTLWGIAQQYLGNGANWQQLGYQGNPQKLQIGTQIQLPQPKQATTQNYSSNANYSKASGGTGYASAPQASVGQLDFRPAPSRTSATLQSYTPKQTIAPIKTVPTKQLPKKTNFSNINTSFTSGGSLGYF